MNKIVKGLTLWTLSLLTVPLGATTSDSTSLQLDLDEVVILSNRETTPIKSLPTSSSTLNIRAVQTQQISTIRNLSARIPNFFIPDYGSKMSTATYIRGIGARSGGQSIGLYVDNVPVLEKSAMDIDLYNIQRIEVLRGPQSTLYGRNAMSGIINIYTLSPFETPTTSVNLRAGNYGELSVCASTGQKITNRLALSLSGYYRQSDGFFTNQHTDKKSDWEKNPGGKIALQWLISDQWKGQLQSSYDHLRQGAFPYGIYNSEDQTTANPNFNDESSYERELSNNSLTFEFKNQEVRFTSTTAYQYLSDNMRMDQDYTPLSLFTINQRQKQHNFNQEFTLLSNHQSRYQWSFGAYSFYQDTKISAPVTFEKDGVATILQPIFDKIHQGNPNAPLMTIKDESIIIPGEFKSPVFGAALYHQSTINDLIFDGLSLTAGVRVDYEKNKLNYDTNTQMNLSIQMGPGAIPMVVADTLRGDLQKEFIEVLPKVALLYNINKNSKVYATVTKGYKTGGYNIQMFSDLIQGKLMSKYNRSSTTSEPLDIRSTVSYDPEYSWNYEIGGKCAVIPELLHLEGALFLIKASDLQLTQFVPSGKGRMLVNAAKATSKGVELSLNGHYRNLAYFANYGFTDARFDEYKSNVKNNRGELVDIDYKGNHLPFAPQNTLSLGVDYQKNFQNKWINGLSVSAQYVGCGKIYWTEANDAQQDYYQTIHAKVTLQKSRFNLSLWGKNLLNSNYNTFYFKSRGTAFAQRGAPLQFGVDLGFRL